MTEKVWVKTLSRGRSPDVYHTDRECVNFPESERQSSLSEAKKRDLRECQYCSGEFSPTESHGNTKAQYNEQVKRIQAADPSLPDPE